MSKPILRPGERYREVKLKDDRTAILRAPDWHDLDGLLALIGELVDERAEILRTTKPSRAGEAEWLGARLASIEKGDLIALLAELGGRLVGSAEVERWGQQFPEVDHVGVVGIGILKTGRGIGLGTALLESLIQLSKEVGFKVLILDTFATNTVAQGLYKKIGFTEVGRIPKAIHRNGNYVDLIRFSVEI